MICTNCGNSIDSIHRFCPKCGAPIQAPTPPPAAGYEYQPPPYSPPPAMGGPPFVPPKRSSGCGKWILIISLILVLLGLGITAAIYYGYRYTEQKLKSSEAYAAAVSSLKDNSEVREAIGDIQDTGFPVGAYSQNSDGSGTAAFFMAVHGTKSTGSYQVELLRSSGNWRVVNGVLKTANGDTIYVVKRMGTLGSNNDNINSNANVNAPPDAPLPPGTISGGILNAKATSLPKPIYPSAAKAVKAVGTVMVRVLVDESGNVVTASAVSGHPLLRAAAVAAAKQAKFTPTKLSGKPVKVSGIITYSFTGE